MKKETSKKTATKNLTTKVKKIKTLSKHNLVKQHLIKFKNITSWKAIELYGETRLSAIIFNLKNKEKFEIITKLHSEKDRNSNDCTFAKYHLISSPEKSQGK